MASNKTMYMCTVLRQSFPLRLSILTRKANQAFILILSKGLIGLHRGDEFLEINIWKLLDLH